MSLASAPSISPIARTIPGLPIFDEWKNPLPSTFSQLDNRQLYLSTDFNKILEMHPNGTRGVPNHTEYCILTIFVVTINASLGTSWWDKSKGTDGWSKDARESGGNLLSSQHVIMGSRTGKFLCMDDNSVPYQRSYVNDSSFSRHCYFHHEQKRHMDSYYRLVNGTTKWYLGINRDGSIRCGNVTRGSQRAAKFIKSHVKNNDSHSPSEPYRPRRKPCCRKKKCSPKRCRTKPTPVEGVTKKDKNSRRDKCKCAKSKRWCAKKRRQFFKLSLKELKRYYKKCIKERKKRHCKCAKERKKDDCKDR